MSALSVGAHDQGFVSAEIVLANAGVWYRDGRSRFATGNWRARRCAPTILFKKSKMLPKFASFLVSFVFVLCLATAASADGGGRDAISPFLQFEYSDDTQSGDDPEGDPEFRSLLQKGAEGEFELKKRRNGG